MQNLLRSNSIFILLAGLLIAAQLFHDPLFELCLFEKSLILDGEIWRLISAFLVHSNLAHCALNLAGLAVIAWFWQGAISQAHWFGLMVASALFVSGNYLFWYPVGTSYFGFSAILYSLIGALCLITWRRQCWLNGAVVALIGGRALLQWLEPNSTQTMSELIDAPVASVSHLYGLLFGVLWGLAYLFCCPKSR